MYINTKDYAILHLDISNGHKTAFLLLLYLSVTVRSSQKVRENRNDNLGTQETLCTAHETKKNQNIKHNMTTIHAVK